MVRMLGNGQRMPVALQATRGAFLGMLSQLIHTQLEVKMKKRRSEEQRGLAGAHTTAGGCWMTDSWIKVWVKLSL